MRGGGDADGGVHHRGQHHFHADRAGPGGQLQGRAHAAQPRRLDHQPPHRGLFQQPVGAQYRQGFVDGDGEGGSRLKLRQPAQGRRRQRLFHAVDGKTGEGVENRDGVGLPPGPVGIEPQAQPSAGVPDHSAQRFDFAVDREHAHFYLGDAEAAGQRPIRPSHAALVEDAQSAVDQHRSGGAASAEKPEQGLAQPARFGIQQGGFQRPPRLGTGNRFEGRDRLVDAPAGQIADGGGQPGQRPGMAALSRTRQGGAVAPAGDAALEFDRDQHSPPLRQGRRRRHPRPNQRQDVRPQPGGGDPHLRVWGESGRSRAVASR